MTSQSTSALITRRARLTFVGKLAANTNTTLTAKDWNIKVPCGACGLTHSFDLSLVERVKSANVVVAYRCPTFHLDAGLTLSAIQLRQAHKYLWRSHNPGWLNSRLSEMKKHINQLKKRKQQTQQKQKRIERPTRINPMPGMTRYH